MNEQDTLQDAAENRNVAEDTGAPPAGAGVPPSAPARAANWPRLAAALIDIPAIAIVAAAFAFLTGLGSIDPLFGPATVWVCSAALYHVVMEASIWHATVGKRVMKLQVINADGSPIGVAKALHRSYLRFVSWLFVGLPHLTILAAKDRIAVHDYLTRTRTVSTRTDSQPGIQIEPSATPTRDWKRIALLVTSHAFMVLVLLSTALLIKTATYMRGIITEGYDAMKPTLQLIEGYYREHGDYPVSLEALHHNIPRSLPNLESVNYVTKTGALVLKFNPEIGLEGAMFIAPYIGIKKDEPKGVTWICGGTDNFLQSYLPRECMSIGSLRLERLRQGQSLKH